VPHALHVRIGERRIALLLSGDQVAAEPGPVSALPHGRPLLLGLTTVQGRALPLIDLTSLLPGAQQGEEAALILPPLMVLTDLDGERVALGVDEVLGVSLISAPPPSTSLLIDLPEAQLLNSAVLASELRAALT
jgi:chemotaxis signal transduction protein